MEKNYKILLINDIINWIIIQGIDIYKNFNTKIIKFTQKAPRDGTVPGIAAKIPFAQQRNNIWKITKE